MCHRPALPEPCDLVCVRPAQALVWLIEQDTRLARNARKKELRAGAPRRARGPRERWYDANFRVLHAQGWETPALAAHFRLTVTGAQYAHSRLGLVPNRKRGLRHKPV